MSTIRNLKNQESFPFSLEFRNYSIFTKGTIPPNLDRVVRLEISENLDTPREVVLVLVFVISGKCCSIRKLKFPQIQTKIFLQMESAIGLSLARAFLIVFLITI